MTLGLSGVASASSGSFDAQTFRVGSHVLSVGDSVARVVRLLGKPVYKEPIENRFGARRGEEWQYSLGNHALTLIIANGKVVAMRDQFEVQ
ncbi:DUF2845 domain-containing protein [Oleiagrimonas sp. C23AA]|nr:DUF2845 domain-containing protein [Oleiagrimonas sp. C23AA]